MEQPGSRFHLLVLERGGDVVAALPLFKAGARYRTLMSTYTSSMDVVAVPDPDVSARLPEWVDSLSFAQLYRLPDGSPIVDQLDQHPRWSLQSRISCPYVDMSDGIDAVRSRWSRKFRSGLRRRWRRLQELGEVVVVDHHQPSEISSVLGDGLKLEAAGWKGREGVAVLSRPGYEAWFRSVAEVAEENGWLRLSALYLDGRMIAFHFDLVYDNRRHGLVRAYDESEEVAPHSPGNALVDASLEVSADAGLSTYEFGYGSQGWKYDWASEERHVNDIVVFGSGVTGGLLSMARRIKG
jgi:CelD/BcsL family acetyltransferase involved in cellulose biosynthesis